MTGSATAGFPTRFRLASRHEVTNSILLHSRGSDRGQLLRAFLQSGASIVLKCWRIRDLKERLKSLLRCSNGYREWRIHCFLHKSGLPVPLPHSFQRLKVSGDGRYEVMAVEDLGEAERGLSYLKRMIAAADDHNVQAFERSLIDITSRLFALRIVDIDHQLNNILVIPGGHVLRIDFECARRPFFAAPAASAIARMIARLIVSHVYAVQPDVARSEDFARALYGHLDLDVRLRPLVQSSVDEYLAAQHRKVGIASAVRLPD